MRMAGLLLGPAVLAFLIATALSSIVSEPSSESQSQATGLVWDGRVFTSRAEFAEWLEDRGVSIQAWERRHPSSPWATAKPTQTASPSDGQDVAPRAEQDSNWLVLALGGVLVLILGLTAAAALRLRLASGRVMVHAPRVARPARPTSENRAKPSAATRPQLAGAGLAVRRGIEAVQPRVHSAALAARRGVEVAKPRLESAGLTARQRVGTASAQTVDLGLELRYAIATGRFRGALFYVLAGLCSAAIGLAVAITA